MIAPTDDKNFQSLFSQAYCFPGHAGRAGNGVDRCGRCRVA